MQRYQLFTNKEDLIAALKQSNYPAFEQPDINLSDTEYQIYNLPQTYPALFMGNYLDVVITFDEIYFFKFGWVTRANFYPTINGIKRWAHSKSEDYDPLLKHEKTFFPEKF